MIVTDEELEEEYGERCLQEEEMEDNYSQYDVPDIPGTVPESNERSINQKPNSQEKRKDKKRNQSTSSAYHEYDNNKKYNQSQSKSRPGRGRGEKDKKPRGKRYSETNEASYPTQHMSEKERGGNIDSNAMDNWGDDTLYWVPENENGEHLTHVSRNICPDNRVSDPRRQKSGPSQTHDRERGQHVQYRELEAPNIESTYPPGNKLGHDTTPGFVDPGVVYNRQQGFTSTQRATLPTIPPHRPTFDQPIRLLPHCPVRQVMMDHGQTVIPRRKLPQIPTTKPSQPSNFFDKLFRHSINVDSITKQENPDGATTGATHQSNPDVHYLSLPRNNPPQQLAPRQLPTAPVLGARRTFSFNQPLLSPGDEEGRRSPSQRFSYHDALRGGRASAVPFRHATMSGNQVQFQDQYSSLPRERNISRVERYNSLQGSRKRNYSAARPASYDPRRLSFHEQGRPIQNPTITCPNKRFSLRADNRFPVRDNMAALHVVGNQQGFHYPLNTKPKRLSGQHLGKFDQLSDEPSPPPAVANLTPSETATEPDYDVYEVPQSIDNESMNSQDRYEQEISTFVPEDGSAFNRTIPDIDPSGRKTSMGRGYKETQGYWPEEDDRMVRRDRPDADVTAVRQASQGRSYQSRDMHWQEEDEAARRERLRQNLQKQISEEATGTTTMSIGTRLTKQGSCDYHGAGATSLELDYEYDEPEQLGFYHLPESDAYEREYSHSYGTKTQGNDDIDRHLDELQEQQYQYDRQREESQIEIDRRYGQNKQDNEPNDEINQRGYEVDMRLRRATERTLAQELSEAYVEEGYVDDYQEEHTYPASQRQATAYQGAVSSEFYYEDDSSAMQRQQDIDNIPDRRRYRPSKEGFERGDNDGIIYDESNTDSNQRYYEEEDRQRYPRDECNQGYSRIPTDPSNRGNRNRYDYGPSHGRGRGQKQSPSSNLGREREMSDIIEGSSQVLSPSEEDQQYLTSEDSQILNPKSRKEVDERQTSPSHSPRHRRRPTDDYSDTEAHSSYKARGKKDPQKTRSSKATRHDTGEKSLRKHQQKEHSRRLPPEEEEILLEDDYAKPHERKNKGARPRKSEDNKPRKHHIEKKTEYEGSDLGVSESQHPASKKSARKSTSSRHTNEDKPNQRRHQSQAEEQEASGNDSHRQRRQRQSIRRQRPVETTQPTSEPIHRSRHSSSARAGEICEDMVEDDGDCFGSDEFNYDRDGQGNATGNRSSGSNMKYMDDRSNCRKK